METVRVALTAITTSFNTSTREVRGSGRDSVAEDSTIAHLASSMTESIWVFREHSSRKSVLRVVGKLKAVLFRRSSPKVESRTEELFRPRGRVDFDVLKNHRLNKVSILKLRIRHIEVSKSMSNSGTVVGYSSFNLTDQLRLLTLHDNRSKVDSRIHGVPNNSSVNDLGNESFSKFIILRVFDNKSLGVNAGLPIVSHSACVAHVHC